LELNRKRPDSCAPATAAAALLSLLLLQVRAVQLRNLSWPDQLRLMSRTAVFITTQGSSSFRFIFIPRGSTAVIIGGPDTYSPTLKNFHELDMYFPLRYVQFARYEADTQNAAEYEVLPVEGNWPSPFYHPLARRAWLRYNANVRIDVQRLRGLLDDVLQRPNKPAGEGERDL
jgi:hypothetical protein